MKIGILALQGGVVEHLNATKCAAKSLGLEASVRLVRRRGEFSGLDALIIPGGESTVLSKLVDREDCWEELRAVKNIFGTCAGAILLAKEINGRIEGQRTLELMDIFADRNAYGAQVDSFEAEVEFVSEKIAGVFIRAPKIRLIGGDTSVVARCNGEVVGIEQRVGSNYYLALAFHPELRTSRVHEYFLSRISR